MTHELQLKPLRPTRFTPWGWRAVCPCGWESKPPFGTKKQARREWLDHRAEALSGLEVETGQPTLRAHLVGQSTVASGPLSVPA